MAAGPQEVAKRKPQTTIGSRFPYATQDLIKILVPKDYESPVWFYGITVAKRPTFFHHVLTKSTFPPRSFCQTIQYDLIALLCPINSEAWISYERGCPSEHGTSIDSSTTSSLFTRQRDLTDKRAMVYYDGLFPVFTRTARRRGCSNTVQIVREAHYASLFFFTFYPVAASHPKWHLTYAQFAASFDVNSRRCNRWKA